jgi:putative transposase
MTAEDALESHSKLRDWPHSPVHRLVEAGAYMVTAGTYLKDPIFRGVDRLDYLCASLLEVAEKYGWNLQAWAVFPNHYHFVALSPTEASSLRDFTKHLHSIAAIQANRWDRTTGRKVWYQYWDSRLSFEKSYYARLSYVHRNAVHHKLVPEPSLYRWCSAGWFQRQAATAFYKTIMGMKIDRVNVPDAFEVNSADL